MPKSKKRKKGGKVVHSSPAHRLKRFEEQESGVTLQDLIDVVAYQEYRSQGLIGDPSGDTVIADDVVVHIPDEVPVNVGEGDQKRQVGTASPIPGDPGSISVHVTDPDVIRHIHGDQIQSFSVAHNSMKHEKEQD